MKLISYLVCILSIVLGKESGYCEPYSISRCYRDVNCNPSAEVHYLYANHDTECAEDSCFVGKGWNYNISETCVSWLHSRQFVSALPNKFAAIASFRSFNGSSNCDLYSDKGPGFIGFFGAPQGECVMEPSYTTTITYTMLDCKTRVAKTQCTDSRCSVGCTIWNFPEEDTCLPVPHTLLFNQMACPKESQKRAKRPTLPIHLQQ
jgi:hypothetical protein